ncbi:hypothetical protein [Streptomyces sp. NRRL S-118]|nr:hypothetical protein [Streptomyces sp. NRRL S-118]
MAAGDARTYIVGNVEAALLEYEQDVLGAPLCPACVPDLLGDG